MKDIETFIEKAIEGGWKPLGEDLGNWQIIKEPALFYQVKSVGGRNRGTIMSYHEILLDPLAWKAVGKVEGWTDELYNCEYCDIPNEHYLGKIKTWHYNMIRMIDALWEGKTIEEFINTL